MHRVTCPWAEPPSSRPPSPSRRCGPSSGSGSYWSAWCYDAGVPALDPVNLGMPRSLPGCSKGPARRVGKATGQDSARRLATKERPTMSSKKKLALGLILGTFAAIGLAGEPAAQSVSYKQKTNNDRVIAFQQAGGIRPDNGQVAFSFYGASGFKVTSPRGVEIFIDPWRNDPSGVWGSWFAMEMPITRTDIGLVTHSHFDHDGFDRLEATMILDRMAGSYQLRDVKTTRLAQKPRSL